MSKSMSMPTPTPRDNSQAVQDALSEFFESSNAADGFAQMLIDSKILGDDADYRARDLMRINAELVKRTIDASNRLVELMECQCHKQEVSR